MCVDFQEPVQRVIERGRRRRFCILTRGHFIILKKTFTNWINLLENYQQQQQQQHNDDDGNWGIICKID